MRGIWGRKREKPDFSMGAKVRAKPELRRRRYIFVNVMFFTVFRGVNCFVWDKEKIRSKKQSFRSEKHRGKGRVQTISFIWLLFLPGAGEYLPQPIRFDVQCD